MLYLNHTNITKVNDIFKKILKHGHILIICKIIIILNIKMALKNKTR